MSGGDALVTGEAVSNPPEEREALGPAPRNLLKHGVCRETASGSRGGRCENGDSGNGVGNGKNPSLEASVGTDETHG